jgi:hypothetical protein
MASRPVKFFGAKGKVAELPSTFPIQLCSRIIGIPNKKRYNVDMIRAYNEIVEFIAAGSTPDTVARFEPSQETKDNVAGLISKEKTSSLTSEEGSELDHYLKLEHLMRLAKARARTHCSQ